VAILVEGGANVSLEGASSPGTKLARISLLPRVQGYRGGRPPRLNRCERTRQQGQGLGCPEVTMAEFSLKVFGEFGLRCCLSR
jgi:hypothetical protein